MPSMKRDPRNIVISTLFPFSIRRSASNFERSGRKKKTLPSGSFRPRDASKKSSIYFFHQCRPYALRWHPVFFFSLAFQKWNRNEKTAFSRRPSLLSRGETEMELCSRFVLVFFLWSPLIPMNSSPYLPSLILLYCSGACAFGINWCIISESHFPGFAYIMVLRNTH